MSSRAAASICKRGGTLRFLGEPQPNPAPRRDRDGTIPNTGVEARVRISGNGESALS